MDNQTLEQNGFTIINENKFYYSLIDSIEPMDDSDFNLAYSTGVGMLLNLNKAYIEKVKQKKMENANHNE